jgi:hypothetical protein
VLLTLIANYLIPNTVDCGKMTEQRKMTRPMQVIGPDGELMTLADLPPPETRRWVIRRKAKVVAAVRGGLVSLEEACQRYRLSVEEFLGWQRMIERHGVPGLRVTRIQHYRAADTWTTFDPNMAKSQQPAKRAED